MTARSAEDLRAGWRPASPPTASTRRLPSRDAGTSPCQPRAGPLGQPASPCRGGAHLSGTTLAPPPPPRHSRAMKQGPKIGIALGSGGARGWCHIGVLRGLERLGIRPDVVAGTSMGAVVGAAHAAGRLDALEEWVRALTPARVVMLMDLKLRAGGLVEARELVAMLERLGIAPRIEDLGLPFTAVATAMQTGREVWLSSGPTYRAVRASAGIPGVMTPVRIGGRWMLDGGLTNPVPVSAARAMGADIVIAVNPNGKRHGRIWQPPKAREARPLLATLLPESLHDPLGIDPTPKPRETAPNYFSVLTAAIDVMSDTILRTRLAGDPPHVFLEAVLPDLTVLELYRGAEAIAEGERMVAARAEEIRAVLEDW
ncbi:MAG: patatin [Alphaproteobacteria bacterium]|nr:MAG: patatin [Alphaproteobacteria bacterium]